MVRVAGLVGQMRLGVVEISEDGLTAAEQLDLIRTEANELMREQDIRWHQLRSELSDNGITVLEPHELAREDKGWLDQRFLDQILPVVTPIAIDPAHPSVHPEPRLLPCRRAEAAQGRRPDERALPIPHQLERFSGCRRSAPAPVSWRSSSF